MAENMKLTVNTGALVIDLEDEKGRKLGQFDFIPTDSNILDRYGKVVDYFNSVKFKEEMTAEQSEEEMKKYAQSVRDQFDFLFDHPVSNEVFAHCGPLTVVANGDFYFETVLEGIAGLIEKVLDQRIQKKLNKIKKATGKYHA